MPPTSNKLDLSKKKSKILLMSKTELLTLRKSGKSKRDLRFLKNKLSEKLKLLREDKETERPEKKPLQEEPSKNRRDLKE